MSHSLVCSICYSLTSTLISTFMTFFFFFFNDTATTEIYTLSLHDALPISSDDRTVPGFRPNESARIRWKRTALDSLTARSEEHTSELQSLRHLVCRLLLEKKKKYQNTEDTHMQHITVHNEDEYVILLTSVR